MTNLQIEILGANIMNKIKKGFYIFLLFITPSVSLLAQTWNTKTICNHDFGKSTGNSITISPLANDISSGGLILKNISFHDHGQVNIAGNTISFTPDAGFDGLAHVIYTACDGSGNCGIGDITVLVVNPNRGAFSDTVRATVRINQPFDFYLTDESMKYTVRPSYGQVSRVADNFYQYTPLRSAGSIENFTFQYNNARKTFQLYILDELKKNISLKNDVIYLNKNTSKEFNVIANDNQNGGNLTLSTYSLPASGSINQIGNGIFRFTSTLDFEGITSINYTACNSNGCETATVYIYVSDFLPREDIKPTFRIAGGKSLIIPYDIPIDNYEFKIIDAPSFGTLDLYKGSTTFNLSCEQIKVYNPVVYTPSPGFVGTDEFTVNFCLTNGTRQCAPIKIKVETYASNECTATGDFVWPGDADNNGIVELKDLNAISEMIGTTGLPRAEVNGNWSNVVSKDWNRAGAINAKFADSNGDGIIDQRDVESVISNYHLSHKILPQGIYQSLGSQTNASPVAAVISPGDEAEIQIDFGDIANLVRDVNNISFDLEFNNEIFKAEDLDISVLENSWFGYDNAIINARTNADKTISINFSGTRGKIKSGFGRTIKVSTKAGPITGHVEGFKAPRSFPLDFQISNIQLTSADGTTLNLPNAKATVVVDMAKTNRTPSMYKYPNPANQWVNIKTHAVSEQIERITLTDITGKVLLDKNIFPVPSYTQSLSQFNSGIYFIQLKTNKTVYSDKLEIVH